MTDTPHSPMPMQCRFEAAAPVLAMLDTALEDIALATSHRVGNGGCLQVIYAEDASDELHARIARLQTLYDFSYESTCLEAVDWAAKMQENFPPFRVGRFYVHGSHAREGATQQHGLPITMDAAAAFGTGEHATTAQCLQAMQRIRKYQRCMETILDMGCGTGILAIGAAALWPDARVDAVDNDTAAVRVAQYNNRLNRLHGHISAWCSNGPNHRRLMQRAPYDLVIANILATPLVAMSRGLCRLMRPDGGILILSGILQHQAPMVVHAYRQQGFVLQHCTSKQGWVALTFMRG
jgi:ribosomal protein L11 methyltransferase